jgi:hypothetical protein
MGETILQRFAGEMAAVAIYDEDAVTQPRLVLCTSVKNLFKPGQADVVISPSRRTCCEKNLVFLGLYVVYPASAKSTFCLKDHTRVQRAPISTYKCQNCYPLS